MNKNEYAAQVAQKVNGEVKEVEKANGIIYTGIMVDNGTIARPTVYIDQMIEEGLTVDEAAEQVKKAAKKAALPDVTLDWLNDYEQVKPLLRARLYNEKTSAEVKKPAGHGFDDLVIIPYIENVIERGSVKVNAHLLDKWNVTAEEVIEQAEKNSAKEADLTSMVDMLRSMGFPGELPDDDGQMIVVSNKARMFGAYAVISKLPILNVLFPDGFTVLPSSVHEVIVVPMNDKMAFDNMVQEVNAAEVDYTEQLSNHAYRIAA